MKGFVKVIIAGAIILGIGVAVLVVVLGANGWQIEGAYEMKTYDCQETNGSLDVDFAAGNLIINYYDGEKIKVEYPENKRMTATILEENGTLTFKTTYKKLINFNWFSKTPDTKIWLPQNLTVALDLDMDAGTVNIPDGEYGSVKIVMDAGSLYAGDISCSSFSLRMSAGAATVKNVISAGGAECKMSAGDLKIQSLSCPALKCDVSAGSVKAEKLTCDVLNVDVSAGSAAFTLAGAESEYSVSVDKSAGSCNISDRTGSTDKRITADISAGSLEIKFTN